MSKRSAFLAGLAVVACGARTELYAVAPVDAGGADVRDASMDVGREAAPDVTVVDVGVDAPVNLTGCADGTREGFRDGAMFPDIAGCSGAFGIPGVMPFNGPSPVCPTIPTADSTEPACNNHAGNDGLVKNGVGCDVADLCELGWHVCSGAADVASHSPSGCDGATQTGDPPLFFVTRQSSNGCDDCATGTRTDPGCNSTACTTGCAETPATSNDVFGCGNFGQSPPFTGCDPLDRSSNNLCSALPGSSWSCMDDGSGLCEAWAIVHGDGSFGGALCCKD